MEEGERDGGRERCIKTKREREREGGRSRKRDREGEREMEKMTGSERKGGR